MTQATLNSSRMGRKKENFERNRLELVADPELLRRANDQAKRLGLSLSAYVRQAVTIKVEADEASAPIPRHADEPSAPRRRKKADEPHDKSDRDE